MAKLSPTAIRAVVGGVVVAITLALVGFVVFGGGGEKKVTARFASAIGVYSGTPVRVLGVNVGEVTAVRPKGEYVEVVITYDDAYTLPDNVTAVEVANSLVSDRYIQLTPAWHTPQASQTALRSGATIGVNRTNGPAELDDIYAALDKLAVALGPNGANKGGRQSGPLSELVHVGAENLSGNGTALGNSITNLSRAAQTLSGHRGDLFDTVKNLEKFTRTLQASDTQVRKFNELLAQVAGDLAAERSDLGAAIKGLGLALDDVAGFVKANSKKFHKDIVGLENITKILVAEKASLTETLAVAPTALANIVHAYQPNLGTIATRSNLVSLTDLNPQAVVCNLLSTATGGLGGLIGSLPINLGNALGKLCNVKKKSASAPSTAIPGVSAPGVVGGDR